ncbi:PREDICTED: agamous-like MADS-box protein AGL82 [Tarenaya hassleriana]|uniref:agamous-like MADS-box protein AGL82 n=1 Tax=Tarenaya hassleriana TaxID=28532 RepID=UPI00053C872A|nr:PREDICTED: agamous-like MADS-box protein AGL82 [Tarenaya hassleriana]
MGRKMLKMERIANEKKRVTTYKKRKACLLKKADEFSTLCGVETCLLISGPDRTAAEAEPETWPADKNSVRAIINKYIDTGPNSCRKSCQIHDVLSERSKNMEKKTPPKIKYCTWDEKLRGCSQEELCRILGNIDENIDKAQRFVSVLEQQPVVPWSTLGHVGLPFSNPHDQVTVDPVKALMMLRCCNGYNFFPGICIDQEVQYGSVPIQGPAYFEPHWTQENIVFNGTDQFISNRVNKWENSGNDQM